MKKLIKKTMVIVVMSTTLLVNANEILTLRHLNNEKTTMLTLLNVNKGSQLIMKDSYGQILYKEYINKSGELVRGYDLSSLPNGKYYFVLNGKSYKKMIPFRIKNNKVEYNKEMESTIQKSINRSQAGKVVESNAHSTKKNNSVNSSIESAKGLEDKILNFKGQYYTKYNNKN